MSAKCMNNWLSERASEQVSECIILHRIISRSHVTTTTTTPTTIHNKGKHSWSLSRIWTPPRTHTQRFFISWIRQKKTLFFSCFFRIEQRRQARERGKIWFYCLGQSSLNCNSVSQISDAIELLHTPCLNFYDGWFIIHTSHRANPFICVVSRCNTNMCTGVRLYSVHSISTHNSSRQSQNTDSAGFFPFKIGSCRTLV